MAAYGALVSVMQIIDQLHRHPHPPISLDEEQVESLSTNITFLQEFLRGYNPRVSYTSEADPLESRILEAAYAAEDVIESYIVDQICARSTDHDGGSYTKFYQGLSKVIEEMDMIKMEIKEKMKMQGVQIIKKKSTADDAAASFRSSSFTSAQKVSTMVGLDDVLYEMLDKITGGERARQIIPIVGMGGLGKTTLARNIYDKPLVKEYFDICAWSTISQVHNARKILTEILSQLDQEIEKDMGEGELGIKLYKHLVGKRYFIVMDDMWTIEAWDKVRSFFPENENGSRVVVTTRLSNLASMFDYSDGLDMEFLDEASSWNLFSNTVFGDEIFPPELKDVGKEIVEGCRGLPLSIVVVGGLLSKSEPTRETWKVIEENLTSVVNLEDGGSCLQILYTSYNNLPVHLKPCFLYMAVFPEDDKISIQYLIPIMVAEGFIKPREGKSLEEAAEEYLEELVGRNLVLVERRNYGRGLEWIKVHDLLRDLGLREGEKDKFLYWWNQNKNSGDREICQGMISTRRLIRNSLKFENSSTTTLVLESAGASSVLVRSLMGRFSEDTLSLPSFRLLRVYIADPEEEGSEEYYMDIISQPVNLRFFVLHFEHFSLPRILSSSPSSLWNLQTLHIRNPGGCLVLEIWKMPLLRHVVSDEYGTLRLLDPPPLDGDELVLENLHTLDAVRNLKLSEEVVKRIPNIKILKLEYEGKEEEKKKGDYYCLNNLHRLKKLQDLCLTRWGSCSYSMQGLILPYSLKQLTLERTELPWEVMGSKIGWLPLLQVLILEEDAFVGSEWKTVKGQFSTLIFLDINYCSDLECWVTDSTHFPLLEHLCLSGLQELKEIPSSIGDITTLRSIELEDCSDSAVESARRIQEEQEEYDNQLLQIHLKNL